MMTNHLHHFRWVDHYALKNNHLHRQQPNRKKSTEIKKTDKSPIITPESIRGYPKSAPRKTNRKPRNEGRSTIITDTAEAAEVEKKNWAQPHKNCRMIAMGTHEAEEALERLMDETFDEEGLDDTDEEFINEELDVFKTKEEDSESEQDLSDREEEDSNKPYYLGKP
ncbi:hypothetical protein JTB14_027186 [Gonioctena quinquepunctata]|nr:hypothetical protein JTB14_027186 [Gonioctena quinquepunctata]